MRVTKRRLKIFQIHFITCLFNISTVVAQAPHLDLEMSGYEYRHQLQKQQPFIAAADPLKEALRIGIRNLEWIELINKKRVHQKLTPLSLWDPASTNAYPITQPHSYGPKSIGENLDRALLSMPPAFRNVVDATTPLPEDPTLPVKDYIDWARRVDLLYQQSSRWFLLIPWKDELTEKRKQDVRGLYFLDQQKDLEQKLKNFSSLKKTEQKVLRDNLIMLCQNTEGVINDPCAQIFDTVAANYKVLDFYKHYEPTARAIWKEFFSITNARSDLTWNAKNPLTLLVPFLDPQDKVIEEFLKENLHDEWRFMNWKLLLSFSHSAHIHVVFEPHASPHVDKLGGDRIVMNKNAALTEYDVRWTIRHEFGHALGFHDCYLEFYLPAENAFMAYQLDVDNLMCSRKGKFQKTQYEELKHHYFTP